MIVKLNGRPSDTFKNIGYMWSSDVFWIPGPNTTELSDDERFKLKDQYLTWCAAYGQKINDDIINDLENVSTHADKKKYYQELLDSLIIDSSLGFAANADETAVLNIQCLLNYYHGPVKFRTASNDFVELNYEQLDRLLYDIFTARQNIMFTKWNDV